MNSDLTDAYSSSTTAATGASATSPQGLFAQSDEYIGLQVEINLPSSILTQDVNGTSHILPYYRGYSTYPFLVNTINVLPSNSGVLAINASKTSVAFGGNSTLSLGDC